MSWLDHLRRRLIAAENYLSTIDEDSPRFQKAASVVAAARSELAQAERQAIDRVLSGPPRRDVELVDVKPQPPEPGPPSLRVVQGGRP